jgi:hypothetical protein
VLVNKLVSVGENERDIEFNEVVPAGNMHLYLVANERGAGDADNWNLDAFTVGSATAHTALKEKIRYFGAAYPVVNATNLIPMYSQLEYVHIGSEGATINGTVHTSAQLGDILGELQRLYAKVTVAVSCDFTDADYIAANGGEAIELRSISVDSIPVQSYLAPKRHPATSSLFFKGVVKTPADDPAYTENANGFSGTFSFYIPEYIADQLSIRSYLSIKMGLKALPNDTKEFKLFLGDGMTDNGNDYMKGNSVNVGDISITRNTHYIITATIAAFNQSSDADINIITEVVDWNTTLGITPSEPREYTLEIFPSRAITIGTGATSGTFTIATNYTGGFGIPDWEILSPTPPYPDPNGLTLSKNGDKLNFTIGNGVPSTITIKIKAGPIIKDITITRT